MIVSLRYVFFILLANSAIVCITKSREHKCYRRTMRFETPCTPTPHLLLRPLLDHTGISQIMYAYVSFPQKCRDETLALSLFSYPHIRPLLWKKDLYIAGPLFAYIHTMHNQVHNYPPFANINLTQPLISLQVV